MKLEWGSRGRGFKSRRPDLQNPWHSHAPLKIRNTSTPLLTVALIFLCAILSATDSDDEKFERVKLNHAALAYAKELINKGHVVLDQKGAWGKDRPSTQLENEFILQHGFGEYAKWYLGIDERFPEDTKRRYKFPYGDFKNVHRCGVLAVQSRAGVYGHSGIENAAAQLRRMLEATSIATR